MLQSSHLSLLSLLLAVSTALSASACVLNSADVGFMSDCPHVCFCMRNAASQSDRQFAERAFSLWEDKERTQVKDRF